MGTIFVDNLEPQSGTSLTLGASGDTVGLASGASQTLAVNTPAFGAYVGGNRGPFSASTWTDIPFTNERFDTDSAFDGTTFTVPETGKYLFSAQLRVEQLAVDLYYQMRITTSVTTTATIGTNGFDTTTPYFMLSASVISSESSGGTIKVQLFQSGTATSYVHTESYFCGMKLIGA
tara:strand:+ start:437 stop:964 length:528 start_codon:yes stop_codon:yes gene_type:complete